MAIPTSRTKETAEIKLYPEKCTGCGICISVCKDFGLLLLDDKIALSGSPIFGCIGCGHCMIVCPAGAIEIYGRTISPDDLFVLEKRKAADYDQLLALLQKRRSIREFKDDEIDAETVNKILSAAGTAPMGLPPSDVNVMVLNGRQKTRAFAEDFCKYLEEINWLVSDWFITLMRPFWGKANDELFRGFLQPCIKAFTGNMKKGINLVTYDAPLAMYFYGTPYSDPADPIVAATYAMIAGESLGLGTCMIGAIHPFIQSGGKARKFRKDHGIKYTSKEGLFVIFGHSAVKYNKGIRRSFASVN